MPAIAPNSPDDPGRRRRGQSGSDQTPTPLSTVLGNGVYIEIEGARYEIAPIPIKRLSEFGAAVNKCPEILVTHVLAALETGEFDGARTAAMVRRLATARGQEEDVVARLDDDIIMQALCVGTLTPTDEEVAAMCELVALVFKRKHSEVTAETFADTLDLPTFLQILLLAFRVNPALADRFSPPGRTNAQ